MRICSILGLVVLAACSGVVDAPLETGAPIPVTRFRDAPYAYAFLSGFNQPQRLVIRDDQAWAAAWTSLWVGTSPVPSRPQIDFTKDMIVLAALGSRSTGGYSITVDSARSMESGALVFIGTLSPGARCITTQAFTQPVDIARLPRIDGTVQFQDRAAVTDCP
jgi:hypothetical protein